MFPLMSSLEWLARKTIPGEQEQAFEKLDVRLLATPSIAVEQCRSLAADMAYQAQTAFLHAQGLFDEFNMKAADNVQSLESSIDRYEDQLGSFLVQVSARSLAEADSREVSKLLHIIGDLERISDHAVNLAEVAQEMHDKKVRFSPDAQEETKVMREAVKRVLSLTIEAFAKDDLQIAERIEPLEQSVDALRNTIKGHHIERLQDGLCTIELGFILSDLLNNLERISDHCSNIAISRCSSPCCSSCPRRPRWRDRCASRRSRAPPRWGWSS